MTPIDAHTVAALASRRMSKAVLAVLAAAIAAAALATTASADGPVAGTTYSTECTFSAGTTQCQQTIVIVREGICWSVASGLRLWSEDDIASARSYQGNAVGPGMNGVTVNADYPALVKPHARLIYDSGPHAFSSTFPVDDPTCP